MPNDLVGTLSLEGRVAVVTGAARGLGKAIALELGARGADLVVASRSSEVRGSIPGTIHETAEALRRLGRRAHPAHVDIGYQVGIDDLVTQTMDVFGRVDILVNNAAVTNRLVYLTVDELTRQQFELQLNVNLVAPLMLIKAFLPSLRKSDQATIINMTSGAAKAVDAAEGDSPSLPKAGYGVSKSALERLTNQVALELYPDGIACVALDPGEAMTEMKARLFESGSPLDRDRTQVDPERTHPGWWPARVAGYLASAPDRMDYTGRVVTTTRTFLADHGLLDQPEWS